MPQCIRAKKHRQTRNDDERATDARCPELSDGPVVQRGAPVGSRRGRIAAGAEFRSYGSIDRLTCGDSPDYGEMEGCIIQTGDTILSGLDPVSCSDAEDQQNCDDGTTRPPRSYAPGKRMFGLAEGFRIQTRTSQTRTGQNTV